MKKFLISVGFALTSFFSIAQQLQIEDTPPNWTVMLSNLNQSQISAGFLYNKTAMFTVLNNFNIGNYNTSYSDHFKQAINELHYAADQTKFISAAQLKATTASTSVNSVDIGIINTTITTLNFNEKDPSLGGLTFPVDRFVPIAGRPAFLNRKILLAAPLKEMMSGTSVTYKFSNSLIFNNATTGIKNLVVYFNDAVPVTVVSNGVLILPTKTVNYTTTGNILLKFVATFTDNSTIGTNGYHYFTYLPPAAPSLMSNPPVANLVSFCNYNMKDRDTYKSTIPFQGYNESAAYYGKFDRTVFYHTNNGNTLRKIVKPIIIIDGFDPSDTRKTTDCDCEQDVSDGGCFQKYSVPAPGISGILGIRTFKPKEHESIEESMNYNDVNPISGELEPKNLITKLTDLGYDVIILNIPNYYTNAVGTTTENMLIKGGGDFVERNGLALASYLQNTKNTLTANGSLENITIMGPSMGGLISRYALAYMDKKFAETGDVSWKHNTKLWVSFDSPHLGANIPMGAQANIWFMGEKLRNSKAEEKFNNELNSTAAKQMLISQFQHTLNTMNNGSGYSNNSPFFLQFQNNLNSNGVAGSGGFPVSVPGNFRKIAIINGSLTGVKNANEGQEFLNVRGYYDPTFAQGLIGGAVVGSQIPFVGTILGGITGGIFGASNANVTLLRCADNFYPGYGGNNYIFQGDGQNFKIGWSQWYINHKWYKLKGINNDIRGSLDVVPGGLFTTGKILRDEITKGLDDAGLSSEIRGTNIDTHSFIPSFSSLAHINPSQNWSNPLNTNLTCPSNKLTPFDSYYGVENNSGHVTLTKELVDWLLKELAGNPQAPHFPIQAGLLTGPDLMCNSNTLYSFLDDCKLPSTVTWSVSNLNIVSSTPYSITVSKINDGQGTITATFQNGQTVTKNIWVGKPSFNLVYNYFEPQPIKSTIDMVSDQPDLTIEQQGITSTTFLGTRNNSSYFNMLRSGLYSARANTSSVNQVIASATNSCGTTTLTVNFIDILKQSGNTIPPKVDSKIYSVFPNPASSIVSIELNDIYNQPDSSSIISGELFDMMGLSKSKVEIKDNKAVFSVVGLLKGIYVLKIYINDQVESHQIAVE